jgi:hypothetical protein
MSKISIPKRRVLIALVVFVLTLMFFYGLDHFVMGMQHLPLAPDLTPAQ